MRVNSGIVGGIVGMKKHRERLLAYNEADCVNLQPLADLFYCQMVQRLNESPQLVSSPLQRQRARRH